MKGILVVVMLAGAAAAEAQTPYEVSFTAGGGEETVTGVIDLAPGTTGAVTQNEVTGWNLTGAGVTPFSYEGFMANCGGGACGLSVLGADLEFTPVEPPGTSGVVLGQYLGFGSAGGRDPGPVFAVSSPGGDDYRLLLAAGTVIGKDPPAAAPEISVGGAASGLGFLASALACVFGRRRPS